MCSYSVAILRGQVKIPPTSPSLVVIACVRDGSQGKRTIIAFRPFKDLSISLSLPDSAKTGNGDAKVMKGPSRDGEKAQTEIDPCAPSPPNNINLTPNQRGLVGFGLSVFFIVVVLLWKKC